MIDSLENPDLVDFGEVSAPVNELLQKGVAAYRRNPSEADRLFREALASAPQELPAYLCLYKIHTYMGNLELAKSMAEQGLREAARQAGWATDPEFWPPQNSAGAGAARFALFTLKALSFIELKRGDRERALRLLRILAIMDPSGSIGWPVIHSLAQAVAR